MNTPKRAVAHVVGGAIKPVLVQLVQFKVRGSIAATPTAAPSARHGVDRQLARMEHREGEGVGTAAVIFQVTNQNTNMSTLKRERDGKGSTGEMETHWVNLPAAN